MASTLIPDKSFKIFVSFILLKKSLMEFTALTRFALDDAAFLKNSPTLLKLCFDYCTLNGGCICLCHKKSDNIK
jgi:hypothetical protein